MPANSDHKAVIRQEDIAFTTTFKALKDTYGLLDYVTGLYDFIGQSTHKSQKMKPMTLAVVMTLLLGARYALVKGTLELMRGHNSEAYIYLRSAIEYAGTAHHIYLEPALTSVWIHASAG